MMEIAVRKQILIERLMRIEKEDVLSRYEQLLIEAELYSRTEESLKAIEQGEVMNIGDFKANNKQWLKQNSTR